MQSADPRPSTSSTVTAGQPPQSRDPAPVRDKHGQGSPPRSPADDCVHCGFCLPHCPTYVSWGEEMDSPRGRIDLFRALGDGRIALDENVVRAFDRCLGCMGCMTACPSGVRYDVIIEQARAHIERAHRRPLAERLHRGLVFALFPHPGRLRAAALFLLLLRVTGLRWSLRRSGLLRLLSSRLAQLEALAPDVGVEQIVSRLPSHTPAQGERRLRVALLGGCVQRVFFPGVNAATVRVLSAEGCEVVVPPRQGCCGALSVHAGREDEARCMAKELITRFEAAQVDAIAVNAAGCGSHMKDYGRLFAEDPEWAGRAAAVAAKVKDVAELLTSLGPRAKRHPMTERIAYHSSCHLGHAQRLQEPPRALLRGIPGVDLVEVPEPDACCGSAGVYNLFQVESASEIGRRKAENVLSTKAGLLASANPGCTLHIQRMLRERGAGLRAAHPIEVLDWSIRGVRE